MLTEAVWCARDAGAHDLVRQSVDLLRQIELPAGSAKAPVAAGLIAYGRLAAARRRARRGPRDARPVRGVAGRSRRGRRRQHHRRLHGAARGRRPSRDRAAGAAGGAGQGRGRARLAALHPGAPRDRRLLLGDLRGADSAAQEGLSLAADIGMDIQVTALRCIAVRLEPDPERSRAMATDLRKHADVHPTNTALASWGLGLLDLAGGRAGPPWSGWTRCAPAPRGTTC